VAAGEACGRFAFGRTCRDQDAASAMIELRVARSLAQNEVVIDGTNLARTIAANG
jgi:hypothetical protein